MKRFMIALTLLLCMLCPSTLAEMDLSAMSNDDLLALESKIKLEKASRGLPASALLVEGIYNVGENRDIPAGRYTIIYQESKTITSGKYWISVSVIDAEGTVLAFKELVLKDDGLPLVSFYLPEGSTFVVRNGGAIVRLVKEEGIIFK